MHRDVLLGPHRASEISSINSAIAVDLIGQIASEDRFGGMMVNGTGGQPDTHLGAQFPNPLDPPSGCMFHPRCSHAMAHCSRDKPPAVPSGDGHVECFLYSERDSHAA